MRQRVNVRVSECRGTGSGSAELVVITGRELLDLEESVKTCIYGGGVAVVGPGLDQAWARRLRLPSSRVEPVVRLFV